MRILFATYSLAFQSPGGGERVLLALQRELVRAGHTVDVFDPFLHDVRDYDLIHYFSCLETSFWDHCKALAPATPLVVTPTLNAFDTGDRRRWSDRGRRFRHPDLWLPATQLEADHLSEKYRISTPRIQVLANGLSEAFTGPRAKPELFRDRFGISGDFVLHVGRFHPVKRQPALITACKSVDARLVLIGDPDLNEERYFELCMDQVQGSDGRVLRIPAIAQEDPLLASAYAAARVFALPSEFETFGIAAAEAAVSGCRLVLSSRMASRDLFEPLARWIDPGVESGLELAQAIREALADTAPEPEPHQRRRTWLKNSLRWSEIARDLTTYYARVQDCRPRPREPAHPV